MTEVVDKDIALLDRVLSRLAVAEDDQLEKELKLLLIPVLEKLKTSHELVRRKVMEVLSHINKRVKPLSSIKLPVHDLLAQFVNPASTPFLLNFNIIYLEMGFVRSTLQEQKDLACQLLLDISKRSAMQQDILLHMFCTVAGQLQIPVDETERANKFVFAASPADVRVIVDFFLDVILTSGLGDDTPPGLSAAAYKRVTSKIPKDKLVERKTGILDFVTKSNAFAPNEAALLLIAASCDVHHDVVRRGEDGLKRIKVDFEDKQLVQRLYALFQGSPDWKPAAPAASVPAPAAAAPPAAAAATPAAPSVPDAARRPVGPILKTKLLTYLSKSNTAANMFPNTLQVIFDSVYGEATTIRLKQGAMSFVQWVFRQAADAQLKAMSTVILSGLLKLLDQLNTEQPTNDTNQLKSFTYNAIGLLARRVPSAFAEDVSVLTMFFERLGTEDQRVRAAIQESLQMFCQAYEQSSPETLSKIQSLLLQTAEKSDYQSKFVALIFANRLYPFAHIPSRFMCLLNVEDSKLEVKEEAFRGLRPFVQKDHDIVPDPTAPHPPFVDLVAYIGNAAAERQKTRKGPAGSLAFSARVYEEMLKFMHTSLANSAKAADLAPHRYIAQVLEAQEGAARVSEYRSMLDAAVGSGSPDLHHAAISALLELLSYKPDVLGRDYVARLDWLQSMLAAGENESREIVGQIIGLVAPLLAPDALLALLQALLKTLGEDPAVATKGAAPDAVAAAASAAGSSKAEVPMVGSFYGSIHALGFTLARCTQLKASAVTDDIRRRAVDVLLRLATPPPKSPSPASLVIAAAAAQSLGLLARYGPLPLPDKSAADEAAAPASGEAAAAAPAAITLASSKAAVIKQLASLMAQTDSKVIEKAAVALSNIALGDPAASYQNDVIDALFSAAKSKAEEVHFTTGEALSVVGAGWRSAAAADPVLDLEEHYRQRQHQQQQQQQQQQEAAGSSDAMVVEPASESPTMKVIIEQIFNKYLVPQTRAGACIWLLSLVKNASGDPVVQEKLPVIQEIFSYFLGDTSDITQEVAARGLVFVYEFGNASMRKQLVGNLMQTLTSGKKAGAGFKITEDTTLFPEGMLGKMPKDENLTTYKELCSLANEMGQPDLVYKFMNLASHHSVWNSRKGASFATASILSRSKAELGPQLAVLIPKLYKYSFDPNPSVADAMRNILAAFSDNKTAVTQYYSAILKEVMEGLNSNQWRVREGCCAALADAVQGRSWNEVKDDLQEMWYRTFKVLDDVKETVRKAATGLAKALSNLTTRLADPQHATAAQGREALAVSLPFLLHKGLVNEAEDVRAFSLQQISKLVKVSGDLLTPHVPELIAVLIEALSSMESQAFNYLSFHTAKMNISADQLDEARAQVSKATPISDTLEIVVKHVNEQNIAAVVAKLSETSKTSLGLASKVGNARFISQLCYAKSEVLRPYANKLFLSLAGTIKEKSAVVRRANCNAMANVAKYADLKAVEKVVNQLVAYFNDLENPELKAVAATAIVELFRRASDQTKHFYKELLPLIFIGREDEDAEIKKMLSETWDEAASGSAGLYLPEILAYISQVLESQSWLLKKQGALALKSLAETNAHQLAAQLDVVLKLLLDSLAGRVWKGKESLLSALSATVAGCSSQISLGKSSFTPAAIVTPVLKECRKNDKDYKRQALLCLGSLLKSLASTFDLFDVVQSTLLEVINEPELKDDELEEPRDKPLMLLIKGAAFAALGQAFPTAEATQSAHVDRVLETLVDSFSRSTWNIRVDILSSLALILRRVHESVLKSSHVERILPVIWEALSDAKYNNIRSGGLEALLALAATAPDTLAAVTDEITRRLSAAQALDPSLEGRIEKVKDALKNPTKKRKATGELQP